MLTAAMIVILISISIHLIDFFFVSDPAERILKLDLIALNLIGIFAILAAQRGVETYLEVGLLWALFAFLGTAVFADATRAVEEERK